MTGSNHRRTARLTSSTTRIATLCVGAVQTGSPRRRKGKVQLIDASRWFKAAAARTSARRAVSFRPGTSRNQPHLSRFEKRPNRKIFPNAAFGYLKVTVSARCGCNQPVSLKANTDDTRT